MEACVDSLDIKQTSHILEIGFGLGTWMSYTLHHHRHRFITRPGYSAAQIQKYKPKTHTIVECCGVVIKRLQEFARVHPGVIVVPGTWQQQLVRPTTRRRAPDREQALCTAQTVSKTVDSAETAGGSHSLSVPRCEARSCARSPGWAMRQFDCVFFDDFPLPIADQQLQQQLQSAGSRWDIFLEYCVVNNLLARQARVSGYLARPFVPQYTRGKFKTKMKSMRVHVPANCTYFPYKVAIIPTFTFTGTVDLPLAPGTSAKRAPPPETPSDNPANPVARKRPKLQLPSPKVQSHSSSKSQPSPTTKSQPPQPMPPARKRPALQLPAPLHASDGAVDSSADR